MHQTYADGLISYKSNDQNNAFLKSLRLHLHGFKYDNFIILNRFCWSFSSTRKSAPVHAWRRNSSALSRSSVGRRKLFQIPIQAARIAMVKIVQLTTAGFHLRVNVKNLEQCARSRFAHADYKCCWVTFSSFALLAHHLQLSLQSEMLGSKKKIQIFCGCLRRRTSRRPRRATPTDP